jgi:flotillin
MGNCHVAGPEEALVVSGGCVTNRKRTVIGGCAWAWWCCTDVKHLSLNVITLLPRSESVETKHGVAVTVTAVAQVMVMAEDVFAEGTNAHANRGERDQFLQKALELFVGKTQQQMHDTILQTLEGHLRAILGTLTVEEIYKDRESFATLVREVASPDLAKMGLEILSFTIKDVLDHVQYLESLGKAQTASVVRDADIGKAEAHRDSGVEQSNCERLQMEARFAADTAIANSERQYNMQQAAFDEEVNRARAEADLSFTLQSAKCQQDIRKEQIEIEVVETHREIEVEQQEVLRKEKELIATVHRPAEAERFKVETLAEGDRTRRVLIA